MVVMKCETSAVEVAGSFTKWRNLVMVLMQFCRYGSGYQYISGQWAMESLNDRLWAMPRVASKAMKCVDESKLTEWSTTFRQVFGSGRTPVVRQ